MGLRYSTISFLSDYGRADEFVGLVHSVIRSIDNGITVVDISHDVAPHDVRAAGLMLARSAQYLHPGVVLAVVDPGVGSSRRAIAVEVGDGMSVLVGPDNGLLASAVAMVGGASKAVELTNTDYHLPAPGPTFDGRDIFGPAAAHLCAGVKLEELGTVIDPAGLVPAVMPVSNYEDGELTAEVLWIDHFGNLQLNVSADDVDPVSVTRLRMTIGEEKRTVRRVNTFADVGVGEIGMLTDSYGLLALVAARSSAAQELGVHEGDQIIFAKPGADESTGDAAPVPVELGRTSGSRSTASTDSDHGDQGGSR